MIRTRSITCDRCGRTWQVSSERVDCPECGDSPPNYAVDGVPYCGLHELAMLPCRITGQFLFTTFEDGFRQAWKYFPNARVDGEPEAGERTMESYYCPECDRLLRSWRSADATAGDEPAAERRSVTSRHGQLVFESLVTEFTPSEAWGTYGGKQWYFYARWNRWEFAMNDIGMTDPMAVLEVHKTDAPGGRERCFTAEAIRDWERSFVVVEDHYGYGQFAASYMPEAEMRRLIDQCIDQFDARRSEA